MTARSSKGKSQARAKVKSSPPSTNVRLDRSGRLLLRSLPGVPHTVFSAPTTLRLNKAVEPVVLKRRVSPAKKPHSQIGSRKDRTEQVHSIISQATQIEHWQDSLDSLASNDPAAWTMCCAGKTATFGALDALGATLAAKQIASPNGRGLSSVLWVNIEHAIHVQKAHTVGQLVGDGPSPALMILSGLRWEADSYKWDRVFSFLHSASPKTKLVVLASGANPVAVMQRLSMPVHRVLNIKSLPYEVALD